MRAEVAAHGRHGRTSSSSISEVLISRKLDDDPVSRLGIISNRQVSVRWPRPTGRGDRYPVSSHRYDGDEVSPWSGLGDRSYSSDVLYEKTPYPMPISLTIGDEVLIEGTGAYTTTYASVAFNGFEPLRSYVI